MLRALIHGERDPEVLAEMAKGRLRKKILDLRRALRGRFSDHHALLIGMSLDHIDHLEATMARLDDQLDTVLVTGPLKGSPASGLSRERCNWGWRFQWLVVKSRSSKVMAKALSAGFQRFIQRAAPLPV
ncbi:MAG TPA: hypothetical protein VFN21_06955, partial [Acidimicrobiales bacterium]|nr:hypothetical protein [Acidimicrobiales bacterium]